MKFLLITGSLSRRKFTRLEQQRSYISPQLQAAVAVNELVSSFSVRTSVRRKWARKEGRAGRGQWPERANKRGEKSGLRAKGGNERRTSERREGKKEMLKKKKKKKKRKTVECCQARGIGREAFNVPPREKEERRSDQGFAAARFSASPASNRWTKWFPVSSFTRGILRMCSEAQVDQRDEWATEGRLKYWLD